MERQHKATVARTSDPFEQTLSGMIGLPNGARNGQRIAEARKAAGLEPGFATKRKGTR